ncbi:MAG TPA: SUMF1/EgtB/PvdO family nonheme iron enzyme [Sedimentisphaerales bacterium]|nr:SUMF1/EgtB/PvdO family nonheme iron enzyme [Sedimentisphaerales bacterium]
MASFGRYQTLRELHRGAYTIVYSGQDAAGSGEKFCIKVFQPSALLLDRDQAEAEIRSFLASAQVQQKVADAGAEHWAPIYQRGSTTHGAFYVSDKYDRSLQQLIDGRVRLSSSALCAIVESVVEGLTELKRAAGRPHGNLKAANVLMAAAEDVTQAQIVLSDPLSDEYIDVKGHWDADLRAIGQFVYELVFHRPPPAVDGWQAPESKEWSRLGKQSNAWRNLCNRLLNAHLSPGAITLEFLSEELGRLKEARPALPPRYLIVAGTVIAACVAALVVLLWPGPPPEKAEWGNLCAEYTAWVKGLYKDLGLPKGNSRAQAWYKDVGLKELTEKIKTASYPYKVVVERGSADVSEIVDHPEYAQQKETQKALKAVEDIRSFFDANSPGAWSLIKDIQNAAGTFAQRGWQGPAAYLRDLAGGLKPEENTPIAQSVDKILEFNEKKILAKTNNAMEEIRKYQQVIAASGDPILAKFDDDYVAAQAASASGDAGEQSISTLCERLDEMVDLSRKLAGFVEDDWQKKVDREAFLHEHKDDTATVLSKDAFDKRLSDIREYYYLRPDPREGLFKLIDQIDGYIREAQISNPQEAAACAKDLNHLRQGIEELRAIPGIERYRDEIAKKIDGYKAELAKTRLEERALNARETAEDYSNRIKKAVSIAKSERINQEWISLRDKLLGEHPLSQVGGNLQLYAQLRRRMDNTRDNLVRLDRELQEQLPSQSGMTLTKKTWNGEFRKVYDEGRREQINGIVKAIPLRNEIPDINDAAFTAFRLGQFAGFERWRADLGGILAAFNEIEDGLNACYLFDDELPENRATVRSLWGKWKGADLIKQPKISSALAELVSRLQILEAIENEKDSRKLADIAQQTGLKAEAVYAAWTALGRLSWPSKYEDLKNDRSIRDRIRTEFENISRENAERGLFLLKVLVGAGLKREMDFVEKKRAEDKVLGRLVKYAGQMNCVDALGDCQNLEARAKDLADFLAGQDWQTDKIRKDLFFAESRVHKMQGPVSVETLNNWLQEVEDYRRLDADPRAGYSWQAKIDEVSQVINKALEQKSGLTAETLTKLEGHNTNLTALVGEINELRALPPIKKNQSQISSDRCAGFWQRLEGLEGQIRSIIKPPYCNRIEIDSGRLIFASESLRAYFEPILGFSGPEAASNGSRQGDAGIVDKGKRLATDVVESGKKIGDEVTERLAGLLRKTKNTTETEPAGPALEWEQIRQAVKNRQKEWLDFFYTIDGNDVQNVGWPRYMRSLKDSGVAFSFIPAGPGNPEPFYMTVREITNSQYRVFLTATGAKTATTLGGWAWFKDQAGNELIRSTRSDYPPAGIKWNKSLFTFYVDDADADLPITWITYYGANSYAKWLDAQLPAVSQHEYAAKAGTNNIYPWGNDVSQIAEYAHVRALAWHQAATEYNSKVGALETPPPPVGAVRTEGFVPYQTKLEVGPRELVYNKTAYGSVWPIAHADKPNGWGIYDLVGNVWEWCQSSQGPEQPVICGGSCLSPPEYARADSKYQFEGKACDVGFRVAVPAK